MANTDPSLNNGRDEGEVMTKQVDFVKKNLITYLQKCTMLYVPSPKTSPEPVFMCVHNCKNGQ